jgi:hypothetical protein
MEDGELVLGVRPVWGLRSRLPGAPFTHSDERRNRTRYLRHERMPSEQGGSSEEAVQRLGEVVGIFLGNVVAGLDRLAA